VMVAHLSAFDFAPVLDQLPVRDVQRFVAAHENIRDGRGAPVAQVISRIEPEAGMFVHEVDGVAAATAICVQDADLAGLFEVATAHQYRRSGHARHTVLTALKWARLRGARTAWLQVEADNMAALDLYTSLGFATLYSYHYRCPPQDGLA
ncbi:MAG: GNAT family N-acetyltransferase, partial [Nitratireductor sp.]|nr:GNAT family N-acetyltransferase [Nitratireductor sp.]